MILWIRKKVLLPSLLAFIFFGFLFTFTLTDLLDTTAEIIPVNQNKETILFDENNYLDLILEINKEPESYLGKPVEISGFLIKEKVKDKFVYFVARYVINSCLADRVLMGMTVENVVEKDTAQGKIAPGAWVHVKGTLVTSQKPEKAGLIVIFVKEMNLQAEPLNPNVYVDCEAEDSLDATE
ncbi:hypothetical protein F9B85_04555 [Heliorestis acidaminivorans]|uniref:DUF1980 domain-containing protein n=1 Tax=Heliorestis acidaminivorans TaxID=553427 RepID=A0A6I0ETC4_9FIRM|nr:hypothetical protein [Heliorestis acidaminivorans]KAB2953885.1 hypothetical protein F9B85_04555 [Heliorestis acidaminivorans]